MALVNMTGKVLRFVDAAGQIVKTIQSSEIVVRLDDVDNVTVVSEVRRRTLKPAVFKNLPASVEGDQLVVCEGIACALWERIKGRTDVWEVEEPIEVDGKMCYRGIRRYID